MDYDSLTYSTTGRHPHLVLHMAPKMAVTLVGLTEVFYSACGFDNVVSLRQYCIVGVGATFTGQLLQLMCESCCYSEIKAQSATFTVC